MSEIITQKRCRTCLEIKPITEFYKNVRTRDKVERQCKVCSGKYKAKYNKENYSPLKNKNASLKRNHNITLQDFEKMFDEQDGKCAICGKSFPSKVGRDVHVDHNHTTGKIRKLLCYKCNLLLGYAAESVKTLQRAIAYLLYHQH